ncbi:hypothetical protein KS4_05850 [Poriferisphaera corsica]|uniref:DUF4442 domain-containing protein n=1 Tax=Poriferisphaera corsica TaxID=2528020 RepID=A0A517YQP7_9BACT|nr:hypothetical protein [Poriferisphaera corsica]QDU32553.1 hypothetical protein KS4_05850 [Poriferisphaera corsica]
MKPAEATAQAVDQACVSENNEAIGSAESQDSEQKGSCCCSCANTDNEAATDKQAEEEQPAEKEQNRVTEIKIPGAEEDSRSWLSRMITKGERKLSELSTKNNFWHRLTSWIFLPLAFRSGIKIHHGDVGTFSAILPFRRHNRNWYSAMAGGALLANSEVAGGMYVFQKCGADYTVVCKHLSYDFLRPCYGPAVYRITTEEDLDALIETGNEFNLTVKMNIVQMVNPSNKRQRRVGRSTAHFHITPKSHYRKRRDVWMKRANAAKK